MGTALRSGAQLTVLSGARAVSTTCPRQCAWMTGRPGTAAEAAACDIDGCADTARLCGRKMPAWPILIDAPLRGGLRACSFEPATTNSMVLLADEDRCRELEGPRIESNCQWRFGQDFQGAYFAPRKSGGIGPAIVVAASAGVAPGPPEP